MLQTYGDVEASSPLIDLGVLVLPQLLAVVQHHRGALVRHAKLVGVHRYTGHPLHTEVKRGNGVPQLAGKGKGTASHPCRTVGCAFLSPVHEIADVMHDKL